MKRAETGWLLEAGDPVCVMRSDLPEPHRSNKRLVQHDAHSGVRGEVVAFDDEKRKIQVALRIKGRNFVIGVGEILPMVWLDSTMLMTHDRGLSVTVAKPDEQFSARLWIKPDSSIVTVLQDVRLPSGLLLFTASVGYYGVKVDIPDWDTQGWELLCPLTRKHYFCDLSITSVYSTPPVHGYKSRRVTRLYYDDVLEDCAEFQPATICSEYVSYTIDDETWGRLLEVAISRCEAKRNRRGEYAAKWFRTQQKELKDAQGTGATFGPIAGVVGARAG